jgi:hypothetical protein
MFPASPVAAMLSLYVFVSDFHRVGLGRFLIRVNHDSSVENANYGSIAAFPLCSSQTDRRPDFFYLHALLHI